MSQDNSISSQKDKYSLLEIQVHGFMSMLNSRGRSVTQGKISQ